MSLIWRRLCACVSVSSLIQVESSVCSNQYTHEVEFVERKALLLLCKYCQRKLKAILCETF